MEKSKGGALRILKVVEETTVDGPGFRNSVYCAGCEHQCKGCHNPQSWPLSAGYDVEVETLARQLLDDPYADVTFSGGDPMYQAAAFARLAQRIHAESRKTIWCYTGFTLEALLHEADTARMALLRELEVLVDGPYIEALRDEDLLFRGSTNQRLIDMPRTLAEGRVVLWER